jgi:hypothetical protein
MYLYNIILRTQFITINIDNIILVLSVCIKITNPVWVQCWIRLGSVKTCIHHAEWFWLRPLR